MNYDPTAFGCRCDICPLQGKKPCPPEEREDALLLAIAEAPGQIEVQAGRPLVGASGQEFTLALREAGVRREQVSTSNALLCRSPYDLRRLMRGVKAPMVNPIEACRPRLVAEVARAKALLVMGAVAWSSLTQAPLEADRADLGDDDGDDEVEGRGQSGMMRSRGFPLTLLGKPAVATVNAAFVLRMRRMTTIFRGDVAKAIRHAQGKLDWTPPAMIFFPRPAWLRAFLDECDRQKLFVAFDVETRPRTGGSFDSTTDVLRCLGIGTARTLTCLTYESVEGMERYTAVEKEEIDDILLDWFARLGMAGAHNRQYDLAVLERHKWSRGRPWVLRRKVLDSILLHHVAWSELKHDLGFCISQYTDAPKHKDVDHSAWKSDQEYHAYCMFDVGHTGWLAPTLLKDQRVIAQSKAVRMDHVLSSVCQRMHEVGMAVDLGEQARHYRLLTHEMDEHRVRARVLALHALESEAGATKAQRTLAETFNPGSMDQLRKLLFEVYGVQPVPEKAGGVTDLGDPRVDKPALFYLMDKGMPVTLVDLLLAVIDYREAQKLRGTYCDVPPGIDGRVHPNWNPHVVVSGRLSCSHPNLMNLPGGMKTIYCAAPGHVFLQCDKSQLEARLAAWLSQTAWQILLHQKNGDLHTETARAILRIPELAPLTKGQRKFGKTFRFASQYGAGIKKIQSMVRNYRDADTGERPYRGYSLTEARANHRLFWEKHEDLMHWHEAGMMLFQEQGYLESPIHGRRRYFLDGENGEDVKEEIMNFRIQSGASDDVNEATERLVVKYQWGFAGANTGLVNQTHDALLLEVPVERALEIGRDMQQIMYSAIGDMPLPVDLAIGRSWGALTEMKGA